MSNRMTKRMSLSVIKCDGCGRLGISVDDENSGTRVTNHKCSGSWETVASVKMAPDEWANLIEEAEHYT